MKAVDAVANLDKVAEHFGEYELEYNGPFCPEAKTDVWEEIREVLGEAANLHQAATDAICEARPYGSRPSLDDDRAFFRWLMEPKSEGGGLGNSPLLDLALEFLETQKGVEFPCSGCGSAECACIPVGDEQDAPPSLWMVETVETWQVKATYMVEAPSQEQAEQMVGRGDVPYCDWEPKAHEILEIHTANQDDADEERQTFPPMTVGERKD